MRIGGKVGRVKNRSKNAIALSSKNAIALGFNRNYRGLKGKEILNRNISQFR